jgi:formylglycine-generating enzyme required for sulfatase activity
VSWESYDTSVAAVEKGIVTGKAVGETIIKVITEDGGKTAMCIVTVIQPIEPEEMIWVEGGTFIMGCNEEDDDCMDREFPRHEVTISGYYISKYVVTQKEWIASMGKVLSYYSGDDFPVHSTSWNLVQSYISKLNAYTGKNYRLPTEAEWEYAARGGNKSHTYKYSGSNNINEVAWYIGNTNSLNKVGKKTPNELGIYDMSGNIMEWCGDYYGEYPYESQINPLGPELSTKRVWRGGGWYLHAELSRTTFRGYAPENEQFFACFRLVHP